MFLQCYRVCPTCVLVDLVVSYLSGCIRVVVTTIYGTLEFVIRLYSFRRDSALYYVSVTVQFHPRAWRESVAEVSLLQTEWGVLDPGFRAPCWAIPMNKRSNTPNCTSYSLITHTHYRTRLKYILHSSPYLQNEFVPNNGVFALTDLARRKSALYFCEFHSSYNGVYTH